MTAPIKRTDKFLIKNLHKVLTAGIPVSITASYFFLALQADLRASIPSLVIVTGAVTIILTFALYAGERCKVSWSPANIIIIAILIRLFFLFRPPELSDDIYRYIWDGLRTLSGINPYAMAPADTQSVNGIDLTLLQRVNHPGLFTIYPPASQIVFAVGSVFSGSLPGMKALLTIMDIAVCILIIKLLSDMALPVWRSVLYAWHPIPVLEVAGSGHIDVAGIFFFLISFVLVIRLSKPANAEIHSPVFQQSYLQRAAVHLIAGLAFAFASLIKLFPVIFLPVLLIYLKGVARVFFLAGILSGAVVFTIPFMPDIFNMFNTLNIYLLNWEFSGFIFGLLRYLSFSGKTSRLLLVLVLLSATTFVTLSFFYKKMHSSTPDAIPVGMMQTFYAIVFAYLLLTPTLHPWYAIYLVFLLPFAAGVAGLTISWAVFLSYRVLIEFSLLQQWVESDFISASIFLAPAIGYFLTVCSRKFSKSNNFKLHLS
jgi:hypothetical protein